jgi:hypothetical protein
MLEPSVSTLVDRICSKPGGITHAGPRPGSRTSSAEHASAVTEEAIAEIVEVEHQRATDDPADPQEGAQVRAPHEVVVRARPLDEFSARAARVDLEQLTGHATREPPRESPCSRPKTNPYDV